MRKPIISVLLLAVGILFKAAAMPPTASTDDFQPTFAAVPDSVVASPAADGYKPDSLDQIAENAQIRHVEPSDTVGNKREWWRKMRRGKVDFDDPSMGYPRFLLFCRDVYRWGDRTFNSYDSTFVVPTGKNWKIMMRTNNWFDSYYGYSVGDTKVAVRSRMTSNIGLQLSFMALSLGYTFDIDDFLGESTSHKVEFSFTCARFAIDAHFMRNAGNMTVVRFGDFEGARHISGVEGFTRKAYSVVAYYFFNNKRYAQAAPYCFSKYQRKSAGSFIVGLSFDRSDLEIDLSNCSEKAKIYLPWQVLVGRVLQNDYCILGGYAHNWVLPHNWVLNVTATPYIGLKYSFQQIHDNNPWLFSANFRLKTGAVYNHGNFFLGINGYFDTHAYRAFGNGFHSSIADFSGNVGFRF